MMVPITYLGNVIVNPRRLITLSLIISASVQGQEQGNFTCRDDGLNSTLICEMDTLLFEPRFLSNSTNSTTINEKNVTVNELQERNDNGNCSSVGVLFARGAAEPGNVGILTGPPFFDALADQRDSGDFAIQGVNYATPKPGKFTGNIMSNLTCDSIESTNEMACTISETCQKSSDKQLIVSGYLDANQIVHAATDMFQPETKKKTGAIVLFGDPMKGDSISNYEAKKDLIVYNDGHIIYGGKPKVLPSYITNFAEAENTATFAAKEMAHKGTTCYERNSQKHEYSPYNPSYK